jgi:integrase
VEEILRVVGPIWNARPETARRLLAHIRAVLEHCEVAGYRSGPDPCEGAREELPGQRPVPDAPPPQADEAVTALVGELRQTGASVSARLATEFLILTAARTAEVLDARWEAIDPDRALWRIREAFARNASARTVPLSPQALDLLGLARRFRSSELVFPSPKKPDRPLSNMAILMLLRRMGRDQARPQGFRTAFRAWAQERTSVDDNLIDRGLGYRPPGMGLPHRTEAAVSPEHRRLFEDWSLFVTGSAR